MSRPLRTERLAPASWQMALDNIALCKVIAKREYTIWRIWAYAGYTYDDLLSIALIAVAEGADRYDKSKGAVSTFIYVCAQNMYSRYRESFSRVGRKANMRATALCFETDDGKPAIPHGVLELSNCDENERSDARIDLHRAIECAGLTPKEYQAMRYTYVLGYTIREAGAKMGTSSQRISQLRASALHKIGNSSVYNGARGKETKKAEAQAI